MADPRALAWLWHDARDAWRLFRDPRVPLLLKTIPAVAVCYVIWPFDLALDAWPVLGQLDDVGVVLVGLRLFVRFAAAAVARSAD